MVAATVAGIGAAIGIVVVAVKIGSRRSRRRSSVRRVPSPPPSPPASSGGSPSFDRSDSVPLRAKYSTHSLHTLLAAEQKQSLYGTPGGSPEATAAAVVPLYHQTRQQLYSPMGTAALASSNTGPALRTVTWSTNPLAFEDGGSGSDGGSPPGSPGLQVPAWRPLNGSHRCV